MKRARIFSLLLAILLMAAVLSGCGGKKVTLKILDTEYAVEDYAIAIAKDNTDLLDQINGALDELISDGTVQQVVDYFIDGKGQLPAVQESAEGKAELRMGTNAEFPPYEYWEEEKITGIDAVIAGAIADKLNMKLVIEDMAFDSVITSVQTGKIDMGMAGLTISEDRLKNVNFSNSYATGVQVVIVTEDSKITSVDDLFVEGSNYKIGVQNATTGDLYATWDLEDNGLATIERYNKGADAVAALVSGKLDCVIIDNEPAKAFVQTNNG